MNIKGYFQESLHRTLAQGNLAYMERAAEQRRAGYGGFSDLCPDGRRYGFYLQQDNAIYLQFVILTGEGCNELRI